MAYVAEEDKKQTPSQEQQDPAQLPVSTASAPGAGPAAGGKAQSAQSNPQQPFQSLNAYLTANAPQVAKQGEQIAGNLTNQYGQVTGDINKAMSDFGNQVQSGYTQPNAELTNSAATNPTAFVSNPENVKAFQSLWNDVYSGPENFESTSPYGDVAKEVTKAQQNANLVGSTSGLQNYFQTQNPNATAGGNTLDSVLLQSSPEAYQNVLNAAKPYQGLLDYLGQGASTANAGISQAKQTAADTATNLRNQFTGEGGIIPNFEQGVSDRYNQFITNSNTGFESLKNDLAAGNITPQEVNQLGLDPQAVQDFMNNFRQIPKGETSPYDATAYLTNQIGTIRPESYASKEDYDRAIALNQLTGSDMGFLNPANASQAGTAGNPYGFDITKANSDLQNLLAGIPFDKTPTSGSTEPIPTDFTSGNRTVDRLIGEKGRNTIGNNPQTILNPFVDPFETVNTGVNAIRNNQGSYLETLNPIGGIFTPGNAAGAINRLLGDNGDHVSRVAPIENANNDFQQTVRLNPQLMNQIPAQFQPQPNADYTIPPKGAVPDNVRNTLITMYLGSAERNGFDISQSVNAGLSAKDVFDAYMQNMGSLTPNQTQWMRSYLGAPTDAGNATRPTSPGNAPIGFGSSTPGVF